MSRPTKWVKCPICGRMKALEPLDDKSYEDEFRVVQVFHERVYGCAHRGYGYWGFEPEWDKPEPPAKWLTHGRKNLVFDKEVGVYRLDTKPGDR